MRPFDIKESWLDLDGKPLAGRVSFCRLHTTDLEDIYGSQGFPAENPVYTLVQTGQLSYQVFLKDHTDYTVRFWKYVGNGDMTEDQDNWLFQYSCDVLWNTYGIEIDATTFQLVNNIAELRTTDPESVAERDGKRVVQLGGYNEIGDKPTVMYIWNPSSISGDNGGSVIQVTGINTGRWELVNHFDESGVDVRHFGVFGADSPSDAADTMSYAIGYANAYAAGINRPLYFPSNAGLTWYKINGLNISGALFAKNTRIFGNTGTSSLITVRDQDTYLDAWSNASYAAVFTIAGGTVRTSWGVDTTNCVFDPELRLIIDSPVNTSNKEWSGIIVDALEPVTSAQFDGCELNAIGTIGNGCTFKNMRITESMFASGVNLNTITVFDNDIIDLSDFPTTATWYALVLENSGRVFDFQGRVVDSSCVNTSNADIHYRNAVFDDYVAVQPNCSFENCSGDLEITSAVQNVQFKNCAGLNIGGLPVALSTLAAVDSNVSFGRGMTFGSLQLTRTALSDSGYTHNSTSMAFDGCEVVCGLSTTTLSARDTVFSGDIVVVNPTFIGCSFNDGGIYQNNVTGGVVNFVFRKCNFYGGQGHNFSAAVANTVVAGEWTGNYSALATHFITIDRTNIDPDEQHHTYKYDGNTGPNVLQRLSAKWTDTLYTGPNYPGTGDSHGVLQNRAMYNCWAIGSDPNQSIAIGYRGRQGDETADAGGTTLVNYYLTEASFFSVGTENVGQLAFTCHLPQKITSDMAISGSAVVGYPFPSNYQATWATLDEVEKPWHSSPTAGALGVPKGFMFYSGYKWRITYVDGMGLIHSSINWPVQSYIDYAVPVTYEIKPA